MIESRPTYQLGIPPYEEHCVGQDRFLSDVAVLTEMLAVWDGDEVETGEVCL
jgi:hypothetical protein